MTITDMASSLAASTDPDATAVLCDLALEGGWPAIVNVFRIAQRSWAIIWRGKGTMQRVRGRERTEYVASGSLGRGFIVSVLRTRNERSHSESQQQVGHVICVRSEIPDVGSGTVHKRGDR